MRSLVRPFLPLLCAAALLAQAPAKKASPVKPAAAKPVVPVGKSALNKTTLEEYLRHLYVWGPRINVTISDPVPSKELAGFLEVNVHAAQGEAYQDEKFLISKDGYKIVRAMVFDVALNPFKPELDKLKTEFQPSMGTEGAPVVIVEFTDFQCPFCREEAKMLRQNLLSAYPKEVRLYFKDFPLTQIHPWSKSAAIAGRCIFRQNPAAFWLYHDWVYENQTTLTEQNFQEKLLDFAKGKEIDAIQLAKCVQTRATEAEVDRTIAEAKDLNVRSTPTLFVNGRRLEGQVPWSNLREIIDYEIEYQKTARNAGENCGCDVKLPSAVGK